MSARLRTENTMPRLLLALLLLGALPARAQVTSTTPPAPTATRSTVAERIEKIRANTQRLPPERRVAAVRQLQALGPAALAPMRELLAKDTPALATMKSEDPAAYTAFRAALVEAVGALRDPASAPLLQRLFDGQEDVRVVRAAAEGLGKLCRDEDIAFLSARAQAGQPKAESALLGFSSCRREPAAKVLTARLAAQPDEKTTVAIATALGRLGSSWAWEALGKTRAAEGRQVRALAGRAITEALATASGAAFRALGDALLMVNDPDSSKQLAAIRAKASPAQTQALDALQKRLASSSAR